MKPLATVQDEQTTEIGPRFTLVPFSRLQANRERNYLIKGLIPRVGLTVIWGPPKSGKSFWTFDAMLHVALGWEYRGRKTIAGAVVYCAFEGVEGYGNRAEAFRQTRLSEVEPQEPKFYLLPTPLTLAEDHVALVASIRIALAGEIPVAIVLDTLNRSLSGSESSDEDMGAYVKAADFVRDAFGCAVIVVHHCGVDGTRPRGHTSLTGAVDCQLAVVRDKAGTVTVTVEWMKDGPEGAVIGSRLDVVEVGTDADGDPVISCVVEPVEIDEDRKADNKARVTKGARIALAALTKAIAEAGQAAPTSNHIPHGSTVVTTDMWRKYAYASGISTGEERAKQKAFERATEALIASGNVQIWSGYVWIPS